ncbi:MAG: type II toxin-antitoxin system RelE family toxin [Acidimicrobiia bacterium]
MASESSCHRELRGYLTARRGPYRIVYRMNDGQSTVEVVRIDHRAQAHRPR